MTFVLAGVIGGENEPIESRQFKKEENGVNAAGIFGSGGRRKNASETISTTTPDPNMIYGKTIIEIENYVP